MEAVDVVGRLGLVEEFGEGGEIGLGSEDLHDVEGGGGGEEEGSKDEDGGGGHGGITNGSPAIEL